jgi:hypothetical protein
MRCLGFCLLLVATLLFLPWSVLAQEGSLAVTDIAVTTRIVRGNPVDSVQSISSSAVKDLYCFTKIAATDDAERQIVHVWYHEDEVVTRSILPVRGTSWRTYSKKTIASGMTGNWRVEVLDAEGNLLKTIKFRWN